MMMHFDNACNIIAAVGSGVVNDMGKILSNVSGKPYMIVGTAPSMDGYTSATSSMARDGLRFNDEGHAILVQRLKDFIDAM